MQVEPRIDLVKATLAAFALAALANRFWLHWCSITLADAATGVLVAATVAVAGQRPAINAWLCAIWALWGVLCLAGLFVLRRPGERGGTRADRSAPASSGATLGAAPRPLSDGARAVLAVFRTTGRIERRRPPLVTATALPASKALAAPLTAKGIHHVRSSSV
jgi:hypothetical protein